MSVSTIQTLLFTHIIAILIGFGVAFYVIGGGAQSSSQDASYDQKLDNITNSIVELKNITMSIQARQNGLINFNRTIVKDNPRLKVSAEADKVLNAPLLDEPDK